MPPIPAATPVVLDPATTAFLILDITSSNCTQQSRPACVASVPAISALLKKARDAKAAVVYSSITTPGTTILPEVAPQSGEPIVTASADKFDGTDLDNILKQKNVTKLLMVGTAANGAVLYSAYAANARGYTVAVAEDGISTTAPFDTVLTQYLLLHEPGGANADNKPLPNRSVTLTRSDLVTFGASAPPATAAASAAAKPSAAAASGAAASAAGVVSSGAAASPKPAASGEGTPVPAIPAAAAVSLDAKTTAFLVLDINSAACQGLPDCLATVPTISSLLQKARDAQAPVIYSTTPNATILPDVAPRGDEPTVTSSANKFYNTNLADLLKQKQVTTVLVVGTFANGAVMYTSLPATVRGYTVAVAEDGLSSAAPIDTVLTRYQLLRFPPNTDNKPLADKAVTLTRSDLVTFK
ncbi:MAG TPA: isochorismatase family protein [Chloroflexota bacterium]|nr:isochorismatase family protein [Chloroflexota bacterium]